MGAAVLSCLVFGVTVASAAKTHKAKAKGTKVGCKLSTSIAIPAGDTQLALPADSGNLYGSVSCAKALGAGLFGATFALQDSGDLTGKFKQFFGTGSLKGSFDLTPGDSQPPSPGSFESQDYTGTATVAGGTGAYKGVTGTATLTCNSPDSVHMSCKETFHLLKLAKG